MAVWLLWLIAAAVLAIAEISTLTLVLGMVAGGAVAGAITAAVGGAVYLQIVVAAAATAALLVGVRPIARRHLLPGDPAVSGTDALVGREAVVLSVVGRDDGLVRLNGAEWSARSYDPGREIAAGTVVRVVEIDGATALVLAEPSE